MLLHERILANPDESPEATVNWWIAELAKEQGPYTMPDITMCDNQQCSRRRTCYRHPDSGTVANEYRQSWATFDRKNCQVYWPIKKKETK